MINANKMEVVKKAFKMRDYLKNKFDNVAARLVNSGLHFYVIV